MFFSLAVCASQSCACPEQRMSFVGLREPCDAVGALREGDTAVGILLFS